METIRAYIDNMFEQLPRTKAFAEMKVNMLHDTEDRYEAMKKEGWQEKEIIQKIIDSIGTPEELLSEMELQDQVDHQDDFYQYEDAYDYTVRSEIAHNLEEEKEDFKKRSIWMPMIGVLLIFLAVGCWMLLEPILPETVMILLFMIYIAAAVFLFILYSMKQETFNKAILLCKDRSFNLEDLGNYFSRRETLRWTIASGVSLIIVDAGLFTLIEEMFGENAAICIFLLLIAVAVILFIFSGTALNKYEKHLEESAAKQEATEKKNKENGLSNFIYIIAVIIFLALGFTANLWHPGWLVFLVAAAIDSLISHFTK